MTYEPGAASSIDGELMRHPGEEAAYVITGEVTLHLEFDTYVLGPGDSLHFDSTRPHLYVNNGSTAATGVWYVSGRHENPRRPGVSSTPTASGDRPASAVDVLRAIDGLPR